MKKLSSKQVRQLWLDFWASKDHKILESKSLIPQNDPSLLWINSGVATLKPFFSGQKIPPHQRLVNSQKSLRTNDIDNVGITARHHTFFEMLGNFSIGDYFKKEAILWAYELIFKVFEFEKSKIYITYYEKDQDTYQFWLELGIAQEHLIAGTRAMNFWDVGLGPCGPDTEIFYDRGEKYDFNKQGIKLLKEDLENDRYIEIWNIVFSEFNNDGKNNYQPLKQKNIDTGAGLERLVAIFQDAPTNFDTDLFLPLIRAFEKETTVKYQINNFFVKDPQQTKINHHFRIIADHLRAVTQAIQDGAKPSNTQRGYVIRRLIRRAYRSGLFLGVKKQFFLGDLVPIVAQILDVYPLDIPYVQKIIFQEEEAFAKTIHQGEALLKQEIAKAKDDFSPEIAFKLFETYGFPLEITLEILAEHNLKLDLDVFEKLKIKHAALSRSETGAAMTKQIQVIQEIEKKISKFIGYDFLQVKSEIIFQGQEDGKWYILLDKTPFYATGGGQEFDHGLLNNQPVLDVFKDKYGNHWHVIAKKIETNIVKAQVNKKIRDCKAANHSATHLLAAALVKKFGKETIQLGSNNNEKRLTYDFPLKQRADQEEIREVEATVNYWIEQNLRRQYILTTLAKARAMGAVALENEEYGENVRVVKFASEIIDFCGGTHVKQTQELERFKIIKFESRGTGIFRIIALSKKEAIEKYELEQIEKQKQLLIDLVNKYQKIEPKFVLKSQMEPNLVKINQQIIEIQDLIRQASKNQKNVNVDTDIAFADYEGKKAYINLTIKPHLIKKTAITLREAHPDALIIIGHQQENNVTLAIASKKFNAHKIFKTIAWKNQGRGGGNPNFAMGQMRSWKGL